MYEAAGEPEQARLAWAKASTIIQELADGITDETLRASFLAGPQIQPVLQHAQSETSPRSRKTPRSRVDRKRPGYRSDFPSGCLSRSCQHRQAV